MNHQVATAPAIEPGVTLGPSRFSFGGTRHKPINHKLAMALCVGALFALLAGASSAFAHEHPKDNSDGAFLDMLERPDNAAHPSRDMKSRLCCTDQDAVKVDYELVLPAGGKYAEPDWYVWIDLDGKGLKRVRVPSEKIVKGHAPTGQAYAFVLGQTIQCFVRPLPRS
jgi:hypothetical protein